MPSALEQKYSPQQLKVSLVLRTGDRLLSGQSLSPGQRLTSTNGAYYLLFQTDGNLVLYNNRNEAIWSPNLAGKGGVHATMQTDGNFVIYNSTNGAVWSSETAGHPGALILMQTDGNLVIYQGGIAHEFSIWQSYTDGGHYHPPSSGPLKAIASTLGKGIKVVGIVGTAGVGYFVFTEKGRAAFRDVTTSQLWKVATGVAVFIPGIGPAVSAGMAAAYAIGKATSPKDAIIGAVSEALPGGPAAKAGFDVGIGVAVNGQGITEAGLAAIRNQVPDGAAKAGFDAALSLHAGRVTTDTPAPANLTPQGKAAYYTTKGLVNINAPPAMKKAVAEMVVTNTESHRGLQAAVMDSVTDKDISWLEWVWHELKHVGAQVHASVTGRNPKDIITVKGESVS